MITGGIDVGILYTKAVILQDETVIARSLVDTGGAKRAENISTAWKNALLEAGINADDVESMYITGRGKYDAPFDGVTYTEPVCMAEATKMLCPDATCLLNLGADFSIAVALRPDSTIQEFTYNEKCSAGCGLLLETMLDRFEMDFNTIDSFTRTKEVAINDGCAVFMELDVLSLLNRGYPPADVMYAVIRSIAVRSLVTFNELTVADKRQPYLTGGMAAASSIVSMLREVSGISFEVPNEPQYFTATGAALLAARHMKEGRI